MRPITPSAVALMAASLIPDTTHLLCTHTGVHILKWRARPPNKSISHTQSLATEHAPHTKCRRRTRHILASFPFSKRIPVRNEASKCPSFCIWVYLLLGIVGSAYVPHTNITYTFAIPNWDTFRSRRKSHPKPNETNAESISRIYMC